MASIYLDYAAATPLDPRVQKAMEPYYEKEFYNPSATYLAARRVRRDVEDARAKIAEVLGCRPYEIVFTSGATEANNLALRGVSDRYPAAQVLVSAIEHESVLAPAERLSAKQIPVKSNGIVDVDKLAAAITDQTVLISLMLVNNELGTIQPVSEAARLVKAESAKRLASGNRLPLYLHTDAAQAANYLYLHTSRLGVDLMSINGGKIYGPKQTGLLYVRKGVELEPLLVGGGQERSLRSGTENVPGIIGLAEALALAQAERKELSRSLTALRDFLESQVVSIYKKATINGSLKHRAPHITNVCFAGKDNERLMMELDEAGIQVAVGSACSASSDKPSHVLSAIGLTDSEARSAARFSLGRQTTESDIEKTVAALAKILS